jgi:hypothetical protein
MVLKTQYEALVPPDIYKMERVPSEAEQRSISAWKKIHIDGFFLGVAVRRIVSILIWQHPNMARRDGWCDHAARVLSS